eukprot:266530-Amphidinium_carterae.2
MFLSACCSERTHAPSNDCHHHHSVPLPYSSQYVMRKHRRAPLAVPPHCTDHGAYAHIEVSSAK